jgi:hypothetical protein
MSKFNLAVFIIMIALLSLGATVAGFMLQFFALGLTGWIAGLFVAIIEILVIALAGTLSKTMDIGTILIGGIIIFIGGLAGGFICGYMQFTGYVASLLSLVVQAALLIGLGFVKGQKGVV